MRLAINVVAVSRGGGITATRGLLEAIKRYRSEQATITTVYGRAVVFDGELAAFLPGSSLSRWRVVAELEMQQHVRRHRPDVLFSAFGAPAFAPPSQVRTISNCAYSNLFHPEIDFWGGLSRYGRAHARFRDRVRRRLMLSSDVVTLESLSLVEQARELYRHTGCRFEYLPPARDVRLEAALAMAPATTYRRRAWILFFSGWHPNKNWESLIPIAARIRPSARREIGLSFAECSDHPQLDRLRRQLRSAAPEIATRACGRVESEARAAFLRQHDALCLLSTLESFSNNLHEAWAARIPLILRDAEWSRAEAADGAAYVDLMSPDQAAEIISSAVLDGAVRSRLVNAGTRRLASYPTHLERLGQLVEIAGRGSADP